MSQDWDISPIAGDVGPFIELRGLDPSRLEDPDIRARLNKLWLDHGVIVFRDSASAETQIALSKCFGGFQVHPIQQINTDPNHLEITNVQYTPRGETGTVYEVNGVERGAWLPLHYDLVYVDKVNHGGLLRAIKTPEQGGATLFLDKITLYETLPDRLKAVAETLDVVYRFSVDFTTQRFLVDKVKKVFEGLKYREIEARAHTYPRSIHPLVYRQQGTGRKMLNLSPWFADGIVGMESEQSEPLLRELCSHVQNSEHIYAHQWQRDELVLWDNWRVMHGAEGVPPDCSRHLQRTTLAGDYGLGRLEDDAVYERELVDL